MSKKKNRNLRRKWAENGYERGVTVPPLPKSGPEWSDFWEAMARKSMRLPKAAIYGKYGVKPVSTRWVGAYGSLHITTPAQLVASLNYEMSDVAEKSFARQIVPTPIGRALVGLAVNESASRIRFVYATDAYTRVNENGVRKSSVEDVLHLRGRELMLAGDDYQEGVGVLKYTHMIISKRAPKALSRAAAKWAHKRNMPIKWTEQ